MKDLLISASLLTARAHEYIGMHSDTQCAGAFDLGVEVLYYADTKKEVEYVKRETERLAAGFDRGITTMQHNLSERLEAYLKGNLDPAVNGSYVRQVQDALQLVMNGLKGDAQTHINSIVDMLKRVETNTSESETSLLGRVKKNVDDAQRFIQDQLIGTGTNTFAFLFLQKLKELDAKIADSTKQSVGAALRDEFTHQLQPLVTGLAEVRDMVAKVQGKTEMLEQTSGKGFIFEDVLFARVEQCAKGYPGDIAEATGLKKEVSGSQKGDIIYYINGNVKVVIEAKDKPLNLRENLEYMKKSLEARGSTFGILVTKLVEQLPKQAQPMNWYDNVIVCSMDTIDVAVRYARAWVLSQTFAGEGVNLGAVKAKLQKIRQEIGKLGTAKLHLTNMKKAVDDGANRIVETLEGAKESIDAALAEAEAELQKEK